MLTNNMLLTQVFNILAPTILVVQCLGPVQDTSGTLAPPVYKNKRSNTKMYSHVAAV